MRVEPKYMRLIDMLSNRLFYIPNYQRAYSWEKKHRDDLFRDIGRLRNQPEGSFHFMATIVGLRRDLIPIGTDEYNVIDIVDGQQRVTTLVLLLKALETALFADGEEVKEEAQKIKEMLIKRDKTSPVILQTNHDSSHYFADYLRNGKCPDITDAETFADRELLRAIQECRAFVERWNDNIELLRIIKNQLTFIFHEIEDEKIAYTVFEVLNNRGLEVSWLDKLKSRLMLVAFQNDEGNREQHIKELHGIWGKIYDTIGLREDLDPAEVLRFGATLRLPSESSKILSEAKAVSSLMRECQDVSDAIDVSNWLLKVAKGYKGFYDNTNYTKKAVNKIVHARFLGLAITLRECSEKEKDRLLEEWERVTFRVFGLCRKDARTGTGEYVRLALKARSALELDEAGIIESLRRFADPHDIKAVFTENLDCYDRWLEELRYLLFRYEEHLSEKRGQRFRKEQWKRIWEHPDKQPKEAIHSIEHIFPQSRGSQETIYSGQEGIFVHRLGNLMLLPLSDNSKLRDKDPEDKILYYENGFFDAREVANTIKKSGWGIEQIEKREKTLIAWILEKWG